MKIVNIIGGLGNQMFQYAFAVSLKARYPQEDIFVDTQHYKNAFVKKLIGNNFHHNGYEIDKVFLNPSIKSASIRDLIKVSFYIPNYILARIVRRLLPKRKSEFIAIKNPYVFIHEALEISGDCYYDGYWMSSLYFDDFRNLITKEFTFPSFDTQKNLELEILLQKDNSVTVHIRRGDYVDSSTLGGICTPKYYRNAINEVRKTIKNPVFFIFSNDYDWCTKNLKNEFGEAEVHFVTHNIGHESFRDMQLMSIARCNILANSSFSWWGAYLNQREDHIVYCPNKWHNTMECKDHYISKWIKVDII